MRRLAFALVVAGCVGVAGGYLAFAALRDDAAAGDEVTPAARATLAKLGTTEPYVLFQHVRRDDDYARIAVSRAAAAAQRTIAGRVCERVYFAAGRALCLMPETGVGWQYEAMILGPELELQGRVELPGLISRARISPDGRYGATTGFVTGHSYRDQGFSTHTALIDMAEGSAITDLEKFTITRDGETISAPDFNFWGVTFARDSDRFYATLATGGKTYLIEGSVSGRSARILHENVECPSLSPDGTRIAFKKRLGEAWRLSVLDLATMRETPLGETRSVDDQAEWLDDDTVLYGLTGDVWQVRADGSGSPKLYLEDALSPAVARVGSPVTS
jgi:dipeptidyl aminopeptidase/acylaminoacyl peptidase